MTDTRFQEPEQEAPAVVDRNVEDNAFDWQRAGGAPDSAASGEQGQVAGMGEPQVSRPVQESVDATPQQL